MQILAEKIKVTRQELEQLLHQRRIAAKDVVNTWLSMEDISLDEFRKDLLVWVLCYLQETTMKPFWGLAYPLQEYDYTKVAMELYKQLKKVDPVVASRIRTQMETGC